MGDFDRRPSNDKKDQNKQITMVAVLGAVLAAVVGWQFMKAGPQPAQGAAGAPAGGPAPALVGGGQSPDQVRAALLVDPARDLLVNAAPASTFATKHPASPFVMDVGWRNSLIKRVEVAEPRHVTPTIVPTVAKEPTPIVIVPKTLDASDFKLISIMRVADKPSAIVNGHIVSAGMSVDGARVLEIRDDRVVLQHEKFPDGPTTTIALEPKNK